MSYRAKVRLWEAQEEIAALRAEVERLRYALFDLAGCDFCADHERPRQIIRGALAKQSPDKPSQLRDGDSAVGSSALDKLLGANVAPLTDEEVQFLSSQPQL